MPKWVQTFVGASVVAVSLLALYQLLVLQYESGDAYPPYSSFRADPLGTLALYDALGSLPETTTDRNLTKLKRAGLPPDATFLFAGAAYNDDSVSDLEFLEAFATAGGRLVILFQPYSSEPLFPGEDLSDDSDEDDSGSETEEASDDPPDEENSPGIIEVLAPRMDVSERWGFQYGFERLNREEEEHSGDRVDRGETAAASLPQTLPWHSGVYFADLIEDWDVVYVRDDRPVVIQRAWGEGRIVLATDNFLVTNEAMLDERAPEYLTWLVGTSPTVIFDESHLGVVQTTGLMGLLMHYRLVPVLLVCILLALLFIWRSAASLVPRQALGPEEDDEVDALSTVAGIANLARRAVPVSEILDTCWQMHEQPILRKAPLDGAARSTVLKLLSKEGKLPRRKKNLVSTYNQICSLVNERKLRP